MITELNLIHHVSTGGSRKINIDFYPNNALPLDTYIHDLLWEGFIFIIFASGLRD